MAAQALNGTVGGACGAAGARRHACGCRTSRRLQRSDTRCGGAQIGGHLLERLRELQARHDIIGDVRGRGLMLGIEMVTDRATKAPATAETGQARAGCACPGSDAHGQLRLSELKAVAH